MPKNSAIGEALRRAYKSPKVCPPSTKDVSLNLKNRNHAIKEYGYGPLNPYVPSADFWKRKADMWDTNVVNAKTSRCDNCAAFIQTKQIMECIATGIGLEEDEAPPVQRLEMAHAAATVEAANLGYCQLFHFKCAGDRTCDAWLMGGPITNL